MNSLYGKFGQRKGLLKSEIMNNKELEKFIKKIDNSNIHNIININRYRQGFGV